MPLWVPYINKRYSVAVAPYHYNPIESSPCRMTRLRSGGIDRNQTAEPFCLFDLRRNFSS